jgi:dihydroorotate dehydrogenase
MYGLIRSALFSIDAEAAHEFTAAQMKRLQDIPLVLRAVSRLCNAHATEITLLGLRFRNRVGIAAGFDKNAELIPMLAALGFGFVEIGTVTPRPQAGNPKPRLFRIPECRALINRMGFNNDGAVAVAERLRRVDSPVPVFANIGKNRDGSVEDYARACEQLAPHSDAVVINVSSPNTPGLRDLQQPEQLARILGTLPREKPVLVKIAPDLDDGQLRELIAVCQELAQGVVATNTTISREGLRHDPAEAGGLSGQPLLRRSTEILHRVRELAGPGYPLIGVGGIFTADDAQEKLDAGADLVQAYTGFIYQGPFFARRIAGALR